MKTCVIISIVIQSLLLLSKYRKYDNLFNLKCHNSNTALVNGINSKANLFHNDT